MPKILIGLSILLMTLSFVFGFLNTSKVKSLRNELTSSISAREISDRARTGIEKKLKTSETDFAAAQHKATAAEAKATRAEAELIKAQTDKAEIEARLQASEDQIADLQKRVAEATVAGVPGTPESGSPNELKAMLDQTKQQLEAAGKIPFGGRGQSGPEPRRGDREGEKTTRAGREHAGVTRQSSGSKPGLQLRGAEYGGSPRRGAKFGNAGDAPRSAHR